MSLVPSDSVSQHGESAAGFGQPTVSISPPVYPGPEVLAAIGPARYAERLAGYENLMSLYYKHVGSYLAAYQSCCRLSASGVGSVDSSRCGSEASTGSVRAVSPQSEASSVSARSALSGGSIPGSRMGKVAVRKLTRAMRAKGVTTSLPGGFCYARLVRPEARESVAMALGAYPALGDLLSRPREEFLPVTATESVSVSVGARGVAHVGYGSKSVSSGIGSYNDAVRLLASRSEFEFGSYGHALRCASPVARIDPSVLNLSLNTPVGGFSSAGVTVLGPCTELPNGPSVFLAGPSEKGSAPGWRADIVARLDARCTVMVPRPLDLARDWEIEMRSSYEDSQRHLWESRAMSSATAVIFAFFSGTRSACSLAELASMPCGARVFVGCPVDYERRSYVEFLCARGGFCLLDDVFDVVERFKDFSLDHRDSSGFSHTITSPSVECMGDGSFELSSLDGNLSGHVGVGSVVLLCGASRLVPVVVTRTWSGYVCRSVKWFEDEARVAYLRGDFSSSLMFNRLRYVLLSVDPRILRYVVPDVARESSELFPVAVKSFTLV